MKLILTIIICALSAFSSVRAADSLFVTVSDLEDVMMQSAEGEFFVDIDDAWHPIPAVYVDEDGFCYLQTGKKSKRHESVSDSDDGVEFACILQCPDCGRNQTCSLVTQNKGRCSSCRQIFPASDLSWTCTNCKTNNVLNFTGRCGYCRGLRELCDPDFKNNINSMF